MLARGLNAPCHTIESPHVFPDASSAAPFVIDQNFAQSVRYQQVYGASDFQAQGGGAARFLVTGMTFGAATDSAGISAFLPNVRIDFSTTQNGPDTLSPVFSSNIGSDNLTVYSGSLDFVRLPNGVIQFQQPFLYDSRLGNLLMDVRNFQTTLSNPMGIMRLAAVDALGDSTSFVGALDVNATTAPFVRTLGLWTRFNVTPVPEPSGAWLLLGGIVPVWLFARRQTRRKEG